MADTEESIAADLARARRPAGHPRRPAGRHAAVQAAARGALPAPLRRRARRPGPRAWPPRLVEAAVAAAIGHGRVGVLAREELPATIGFWERHGFEETDRRPPYVELRRAAAHVVRRPGRRRHARPRHPGRRRPAGRGPGRADRRARGRQDDLHPGPGGGAGRARRGHLADVRHRPRAPVAGRAAPTSCTSTPTGSAASTSSTTSTSTPRWTPRSPSSSGAPAWPRPSPSSASTSPSPAPWPTRWESTTPTLVASSCAGSV